MENGPCKKLGNPRWWPRNGCDGRLMAKILIMTILLLIPSEAGIREHKFT